MSIFTESKSRLVGRFFCSKPHSVEDMDFRTKFVIAPHNPEVTGIKSGPCTQKNVLDFCPRHFLLCERRNLVHPPCRVMSPWANNLLSSRPHAVDGGGRRERGRGQNVDVCFSTHQDILGTSTRKVVASYRPLHQKKWGCLKTPTKNRG